MFKRFISIISAICIMCTLCTAFAEETTVAEPVAEAPVAETVEVDTDFEMSLANDVAIGLGAIDGDGFMPTKEATIGELANAVTALAATPVISNKYFKVDDYSVGVKRITAVAVMLDILGYSIFFEDGVIDEVDNAEIQSIAAKYDITDGVSSDLQGIITIDELCQLILNTMEAKTLNNVFSENGVVESSFSKKTYMEDVLGYEFIDGIVQSTSYSSIINVEGTKSNRIVISGVDYRCEMGEFEDYIGRRVTALVADNSGYEVIALHDTSEKTLVLPASILNHTATGSRVISYWEGDDKRRTASLSPVVDVLYNYSLFMDYSAEDFKIDQGRLVLIDNNNDSAYDVVLIEEYKSLKIFSVSTTSEVMVDSYGNTVSISELIEHNYPVFQDGKVIDAHNIPTGAVATCFVNKADEAVRIYLTEEIAAGNINKFDKEENIITLEGKDYRYTNEVEARLEAEERGHLITVDLNHFGEIADYVVTGDAYLYGYLLNFREGDGFNTPQLKIYTQTNEFKIYNTKDTIIVNGTKMSAQDAFAYNLDLGFWDEGGKISQIVKYKANSNGYITLINTTTNKPDEKANRLLKEKDGLYTYYSKPKTIAADTRVDVNTKVFLIPTDFSYENKFRYGSHSILYNNRDYTAQIYDIDENRNAGVVVAMVDPFEVKYPIDQINGLCYVVYDVGEFIADNGEISTVANVRTLGRPQEEFIEARFSKNDISSTLQSSTVTVADLRPGDIFQGVEDYNDIKEFPKMVLRYKHGETQPYEDAKAGPWYASVTESKFISDGQTYAYGKVTKLIDSGFMVNNQTGEKANNRAWDRVISTTSTTPVYIFETEDERQYKGVVGDIQVGDNVFMLLREGLPREIIIYR